MTLNLTRRHRRMSSMAGSWLFRILIAFLILPGGGLCAAEPVLLKEIERPDSLHVDRTRLYVTQGPEIFVYGLEGFRPETRFGKRGEGPGEFKISPNEALHINVQSERILVDSFGRISLFTKAGRFLEEHKTPYPVPTYIKPAGDLYVAMGYTDIDRGKNRRRLSIDILDSRFQKVREISHAWDHYTRRIRGVYDFKTHGHLILVSYEEGEFRLDGFDPRGKAVLSITRPDFERRLVSDADRREVFDRLRRAFQRDYSDDYLAKRVGFNTHWPAISDFFVDESGVTVVNGNRTPGTLLLFLFDLSGRFVGETTLARRGETTLYTAAAGRFYRLFEDEDREAWFVEVTPLPPAPLAP